MCVVGVWEGIGSATRSSALQAGPWCFCSMVRERGVWSHKFIFVHAFLIKRKSECLWFNCFGAGIEFLVAVPDKWAWKITSYLVTSYLGNSHVHTQILT